MFSHVTAAELNMVHWRALDPPSNELYCLYFVGHKRNRLHMNKREREKVGVMEKSEA